MSPKRKPTKKNSPDYSRYILISGGTLVIAGLVLMAAIFWPILSIEINYRLQQDKAIFKNTTTQAKEIQPLNDAFGIVIPKIGANAKIIPNVDPYNSKEYQQALTRGVAHAKGSVYPGRTGNMFIFSHSSVNFFEALRYNAVFYLLDKLETNDAIHLYFHKEKFVYRVTEKKLVDPDASIYLTEKTNDKIVTLMTCWPPGTTFKRLIIRGILQEQ
ncbi:MAG: sortase [Microgenomates group bacterium]